MKQRIVTLLALTLLGTSCSQVTLEEVDKPLVTLKADATFCVNPPEEIGKFSVILFIIDVSGSNATGTSPTDPGKARRTAAMKEFFERNRSNRYLKWGLEVFGGSVINGARHLIRDADDQHFGDAATFETALTDFQKETDVNATPYVSALDRAREAIEKYSAYTAAHKLEVDSYHVVFISDGVPEPVDQNKDADIFGNITRMVALTQGKIHISTVYYNVGGTARAGAIERLMEMAKQGNGRFQDASNGQGITIDDLIIGGHYKETYFIKDLFVYNLNAAQCDDGAMGSDSDADGLCDKDEVRYNTIFKSYIDSSPLYRGKAFSATNRYSFDSRLSDLIVFKHLIEGDTLPICEATAENIQSDEDGDMLNACEEMFLSSKDPQGPTVGWTSEMNKGGKYANRKNFDSDGDGLMDSLEFMFFKRKGYAMNYNTISSTMNGRTFYDYFKNHQSMLRPETSLAYNIDVQWIKKNSEGQDCYKINQQNLPLYQVKAINSSSANGNESLAHAENQNVILVYYIMTTQNDPDGKGVMRYSYQKRSASNSNEIRFDDAIYSEVKAE